MKRKFLEDKSGPLNSEEDPLKVLKGAKVKIEETSHVGSEIRDKPFIIMTSFFSLSLALGYVLALGLPHKDIALGFSHDA